ncbi:hypothetical protein FBR05_00860 [Deltaproteobacteria bacterium PRO3]|nr:hypothetical protein [Deltaproteobacteria bacterium PRO3]
MMGTWLKKSLVVFFLALLSACGGASPPLGIPAPVSSLMTLEGPDGSGIVAIFGAPGAVLPDAVVTGTNISVAYRPKPWEGLLLGTAYAQQGVTLPRNVVAASDGSFRMRVPGKTGDIIRITQTVDGETSPGTDLVVPESQTVVTPGGTLP